MGRIPDAVPRQEAPSAGGNKSPYTVLGKTYTVMPNGSGYRERGIASWYGMKFHGRNTSNGEVYDAYAMSAAHRSLPLPSYVRVTNLENGRQVTVRVNDRGPFHKGRLIDLSYAAAYKLGFHNKGTAEVLVEYLDPSAQPRATPPPAVAATRPVQQSPQRTTVQSATVVPPAQVIGAASYLQVGAFRSLESAESLQKKLQALLRHVVFIDRSELSGLAWYRVRVGPIGDAPTLAEVQRQVRDANLGVVPHVVLE